MRIRVASLAVLTCLMFTGLPMASAAAATPTCWNVHSYWETTRLDLPAYVLDGSTVCLLSTRSFSFEGTSALQAALFICYGYDITGHPAYFTDGSYGPKTKAAVIKVQKKYGLAADGIYGPNTAKAMLWPRSNRLTGEYVGCKKEASYIK